MASLKIKRPIQLKTVKPKLFKLPNSKPTLDVVEKSKLKLTSLRPTLPTIPSIKPKVLDSANFIEGLVDVLGNPIQLDLDQAKAVQLASEGSHLCVVGKAGTGKTTTVQAIALKWLQQAHWHITSYREQGTGERYSAPSIAIVAATNRAANNMRDRLVAHHKLGTREGGYGFGPNITTCHNLLEYTVEFVTDPETGKRKPRYYPKRDEFNKLDITHLVLEEATLVGASNEVTHFNWEQLRRALPPKVQILFLGDINQLPPVIGKSILNYAIQQLPRVELTHVHRQALDNPIIRQALNCIEGKAIKEDFNTDLGQGVRIFKGKANFKLTWQQYEFGFKRLITKLIEAGQYDPKTDMVLSPYNKPTQKAVSSSNLAAVIGTVLASLEHKKYQEAMEHLDDPSIPVTKPSPVYEIRSGFKLFYLRVGDKVFVDKTEGVVTEIQINSSYYGKAPQPSSLSLDYFGQHTNMVEDKTKQEDKEEDWVDGYTALSIEEILAQENVEDEERKRASSHVVTIKMGEDSDTGYALEKSYSTVGELAKVELGYALSVHKSQGSEWPRVILCLHDSNATNLYRELVYTAMTRPRERLDIIAQQHVLDKSCKLQRIKGHTLEAKIEFFNSGYLDQEVDIEPTP